jgi:hypothetical protein
MFINICTFSLFCKIISGNKLDLLQATCFIIQPKKVIKKVNPKTPNIDNNAHGAKAVLHGYLQYVLLGTLWFDLFN